MLERYACNLMATLSHPPWEKELNWSLYTTIEWAERVPFHAYVQRDPITPRALEEGTLLPQFSALPTELQLRILALCPASTLFQVMRVSSILRVEASKLFWALPDASFLIEASWLIGGGHPGYTYQDVPFLYHVQKVEINYRIGTDDTLCPGDDRRANTRHDLITSFWESLTQRLPNARQVVIDQNWLTPSWWQDHEPVAYPLRMLLQACPPDIRVAVFVLEKNPLADTLTSLLPTQKWRRSLYRPAAGGGWVKSHGPWRNTTILVPTKHFNGPVGNYQSLTYESDRISYQRDSLWPLMIEALDRYHFDKGRNIPFICPMPSCDLRIARAGEWTVHAVEAHCEAWGTGHLMAVLPDKLRALFKERVEALTEMRNKLHRQHKQLNKDWDTQGKEKQGETRLRWIEQLQNDPAWSTGEKAEESTLWNRYWVRMCQTNDSGH